MPLTTKEIKSSIDSNLPNFIQAFVDEPAMLSRVFSAEPVAISNMLASEPAMINHLFSAEPAAMTKVLTNTAPDIAKKFNIDKVTGNILKSSEIDLGKFLSAEPVAIKKFFTDEATVMAKVFTLDRDSLAKLVSAASKDIAEGLSKVNGKDSEQFLALVDRCHQASQQKTELKK